MTPQQALDRLRTLCSRSEYCCGQVRKKLLVWSAKNAGLGDLPFSQDDMDWVVSSLLEEKFVDDARFADAYVRDKARFSKWGEVKIAHNLKMFGVPAGVIRKAIADNAELFSSGILEQLIAGKWKQMKADDAVEVKRQKVLRFALGRGFSYDQIIPLIKRLG